MNSFRFSPIRDKEKLLQALEYIHEAAHRMCQKNLGLLLPVAGNIGVFCHFEDEFEYLTGLRKELTDLNDNWNQKYFKLHNPIEFPAKSGFPQAKYTYLYVRKPDSHTPNVGDVDFYLEPEKYAKLKEAVLSGTYARGVKMFERPDLDLVRLYDPDIDVSAFVGSYNLETVATRI